MVSNNSPDYISPQQWQSRGELEILLGHSIFVVDEGAAHLPTIVLLHGFPTSSWDWQLIWDELAKDYRLIALDMLGFGFSDKPNSRQYSIHGQADIVEALVETKGLTNFHVLAHDYGDTVAQELLARQLEGTGSGTWLSCCLLNGGLFPETHRALLTQKLLLSSIGEISKPINRITQNSAKILVRFLGRRQVSPQNQDLENFWWLINVNDGKHVFHNVITYMNVTAIEHRARWVSALQISTIPLAVINGSVDPVSGAHMVARYKELNCRLDYLAQLSVIGHYPQVEAPKEVYSHYQHFIDLLD